MQLYAKLHLVSKMIIISGFSHRRGYPARWSNDKEISSLFHGAISKSITQPSRQCLDKFEYIAEETLRTHAALTAVINRLVVICVSYSPVSNKIWMFPLLNKNLDSKWNGVSTTVSSCWYWFSYPPLLLRQVTSFSYNWRGQSNGFLIGHHRHKITTSSWFLSNMTPISFVMAIHLRSSQHHIFIIIRLK